MPLLDHVIDHSSIRVKRSSVTGETPPAGSLRQGELAINTADGRLFHREGSFPSADGITKIVSITQAAYDALSVKVATTLYIVTPS